MNKIIIAIAGILLIAASCGKEEENILKEDQVIEGYINRLKYIDDYIVDTTAKALEPKDGIIKATLDTLGKGKLIQAGDVVEFFYVASYLVNSNSIVVFDTNIKDVAKQIGLDTVRIIGGDTIKMDVIKKVTVGKDNIIEGLDRGLRLCYKGEHILLVFNSGLGYGSNPVGMIPPYSPICFELFIRNN